MTPTQIFEIANKAGPNKFPLGKDDHLHCFDDAHLIAFVELIVSQEREACADEVRRLGVMRQVWTPKQMAEAILERK